MKTTVSSDPFILWPFWCVRGWGLITPRHTHTQTHRHTYTHTHTHTLKNTHHIHLQLQIFNLCSFNNSLQPLCQTLDYISNFRLYMLNSRLYVKTLDYISNFRLYMSNSRLY